MDAERWKQTKEIFHQAVSLKVEDRERYLSEACAGDAELLDMVQSLLRQDEANTHSWERKLSSISQPEPDAAEPPREDLGPYRFLRFLGQGGMGTVYQAQHRVTGQLVAIKVLRTGHLSEASRERFATEQRALARLNHPSIARLYGSENFRDGTPCFIMEYVDGERLTSYCQTKALSVRDRIILFREVCVAVQHAHGHAIIHRDLKPSNILVKADGSVRLLDFGIAKEMDGTGPDVTGSQPAPMTIKYAAPEQLIGDPVGAHTDVYALGVTLYELLTGRPPHDVTGLTPGRAETAILSGKVDRPSRVMQESDQITRRGLRGSDWHDLDVLCTTAIHKDPSRRYLTVEALIRDLDHWLAHQRLDARQDSFWYRANKFAVRNWRPLVTAAAILAVAAGATIWFTLSLARARDEALREQARTQRVEQFVFSLFDDGDASAGPSKNTTAAAILERGRREAAIMQKDPALQAELFGVLGGLFQGLGQTDQASSLLSSALKFQTVNDPSGINTAQTMVKLGYLRASQSLYPEAEKLAHQGVTLLQNNPKASKHDVASAETTLGNIYAAAEQVKQAMPLLEDALRIQTQSTPPDSETGKTLATLGEADQVAGQYPRAAELDARAVAFDRRQYGDVHPRVADDLLNLANVELIQARYPEAETNYKKALSIEQNWYGTEHPSVAEILIIMSQTLMREGKLDEAGKDLTEGIEIGLRVFGEKNRDMAFAWMTRATLEQSSGQLDAARGDFQHALERVRVIYGDSSSPAARAMVNLGVLEFKARDYQKAEQLLRDSLVVLRRLLPANDSELAKANFDLGTTLLYEHQYVEAQSDLQQAVSVFSQQPTIFAKELNKAREMLQHAKSKTPA